jgi:D-arabinose 1-dehydrogenase-like Zn-dependent alcohol dehydrogenase
MRIPKVLPTVITLLQQACPICEHPPRRLSRCPESVSYDGGAPVQALVRIPDDLSDAEAAPLLCAGITTFNALRNSGTRPGELAAILGIGGLGHLGDGYVRHRSWRRLTPFVAIPCKHLETGGRAISR